MTSAGNVLGNAESGVFLRQLLILYAYIFLPGILIYAKLLKTPEDDSGSPNLASATKDQKSPLIRWPRSFYLECKGAVNKITITCKL